jgi:hypothetical protein
LSYASHKLSFKGKEIFIPGGDQDDLCQVLFKNKTALKREWSWDEITEKWGGDPNDNNWRKVYNAGREINKKVAIETGIKDLLDVNKKTIRVNPKFLPFQG